jgi:maltooligosyltrehalose synthase
VAIAPPRGRVCCAFPAMIGAAEAKINTSWEAERALRRLVSAFVTDVLGDVAHSVPRRPDEFVGWIRARILERPRQTLLAHEPGVPDVYQGNEVWDFSLVDRTIGARSTTRGATARKSNAWLTRALPALQRHAREFRGRARQLYATWRATLAGGAPEVFELGSYESIEPRERAPEHLCALARRHGSFLVVAVVGRWFVTLPRNAGAAFASFDGLIRRSRRRVCIATSSERSQTVERAWACASPSCSRVSRSLCCRRRRVVSQEN